MSDRRPFHWLALPTTTLATSEANVDIFDNMGSIGVCGATYHFVEELALVDGDGGPRETRVADQVREYSSREVAHVGVLREQQLAEQI